MCQVQGRSTAAERCQVEPFQTDWMILPSLRAAVAPSQSAPLRDPTTACSRYRFPLCKQFVIVLGIRDGCSARPRARARADRPRPQIHARGCRRMHWQMLRRHTVNLLLLQPHPV